MKGDIIYTFVYNERQQQNIIIHYINKGGMINFHTNPEIT